MKLFAIFALLICAVLAFSGASPVAEPESLEPALAEADSAPASPREARSKHGGGRGGGGYGGYGGYRG